MYDKYIDHFLIGLLAIEHNHNQQENSPLVENWKFISAEHFQLEKGIKRIEKYKLEGTKKTRTHIMYIYPDSTTHYWTCCAYRRSDPNHVCKYRYA
jgi:hypothetical protein